jgi:myo-inositol-1(or 4)-monophosphatase
MNPTLSELERLARQAGEIVRLGYEHEHQIAYKDVIDPVTEVDRKSEAFLLGEIQRLFPGHQIVSEEAGVLPGSQTDQWYIDPLDGTVNYAHGVPIFSVSIAYARDGAVTLGVVYDPMRDELFAAERGRGSWCNGRPLHASQQTEFRRSLFVTGFPYDTWSTEQNNLNFFSHFARMTQGVRRLGSAALDICYVGAGRFDGYWELFLQPWDLAAGALIASEAGATVTDLKGGQGYLTPPCSMLAASPELHGKMLAILNGTA